MRTPVYHALSSGLESTVKTNLPHLFLKSSDICGSVPGGCSGYFGEKHEVNVAVLTKTELGSRHTSGLETCYGFVCLS